MTELGTDGRLGPAMLALNERQRKFVHALMMQARKSNSRAARMAGYSATSSLLLRVTGHRLAHDPKVIAAIREETASRIQSSALMAADVLFEIANDPKQTTKERRAAAGMLLDRGGFGPQQHINVTKTVTDMTGEAMLERIKMLAAKNGMDPAALLGPNTIEAEFTEVKDVKPE